MSSMRRPTKITFTPASRVKGLFLIGILHMDEGDGLEPKREFLPMALFTAKGRGESRRVLLQYVYDMGREATLGDPNYLEARVYSFDQVTGQVEWENGLYFGLDRTAVLKLFEARDH